MANSYLRFPNNFFTGTRSLTLEERGAYNDLLDLYIARDGELPDIPRQRSYDLAVDQRVWSRIRKRLIASGKIEIKAGNIEPTGGDKTLAKCLAKSVAAADAAHSRWRKSGVKHLESNETHNAKADPAVMLLKTRHILDTNVSRYIPKKTEGATGADDVKIAIELWNTFAREHALPTARKITRAREQRIRARLRDAGGLDGWRSAMAKIVSSRWLLGQNSRGWKADIDFLCQEQSFTRLMEGSYDGASVDSCQDSHISGSGSKNPSIAASVRRFVDGASA